MTSLRNVAGVHPDLEHAWPEHLAPDDPYAGDERLPDPMLPEQVVQAAGALCLDPDEVARLDAAFVAGWGALLAGEAGDDVWEACRRLNLTGPLRHDGRPPRSVPHSEGDALLIDIVEDLVPDIGVLAPDRVLGPWSELRLPRRVRQAAAAVMCLAPVCRHGMRASARVSVLKPKPPMPVRQWLEAVTMAPAMLWERRDDGGLRPLLPLAAGWTPDGPVDDVPRVGAHVLGRAVKHAGGWRLACALPVGRVPDTAPIQRRVELEGWRLRRHEHRISMEDLLRDRSEVLYRSTCEMGWQRWPDDLWHTWQHWDS